jgi:hypothetical protein
VIEEYCKLDFRGARLGASQPGNDQIAALSTWEAEPGWDSVVIISSFVVGEAKESGRTAKVLVTYNVVGQFDGDSPFALSKQEMVEYQLVRRGNSWLVDKGLVPPHVSVSASSDQFELLIRQEKDASRRKVLQQNAEWLRALK